MALFTAAPAPPDDLEGYVAFLAGDPTGEGFPAAEETYDLREDALNFRAEIGAFEQLQRDRLDAYIPHVYAGVSPSGASRRLRPTSEWLALDATDEQVGEFLTLHKGVLEAQRQDPAIHDRFEFLKGSYVGRLHDGIREGWVSSHATNKIHKIEKATLEVGDIRETTLQWKDAQYIGPSNKIIIAQGVGTDERQRAGEVEQNVYDSLPHEASHIFGRWLPRWASEAFAEHMNLVVRNGEAGVINPTARTHDNSVFYVAERALMHGMFNFAATDPREGREAAMAFMRAATSRNGESQEWREFEAMLDGMWGASGVFDKVNHRVADHEERIKAERPDWNNWQVEREAATLAKNELDANPEAIFGQGYRKPQPHVGAAAVSGAVR